VRYIRETSVSDAIADVDMIAEGALKTKQQFTLEALNAPIRKVAMSLDISDEMLNDTRGLTSYITARFGRMLPVKEDDQILYGAGGSVELTGITLEAAPFFNTTGEPLGADVQRMDILSIAVLQAMTQTNNGRSGYTPNAIMINPADFNIISRLKDADGRYLLPNAMERGLASVNGVPVVSTTAMKKGQFLVGDFRMGAQIFDRIGQRIEFSRENKDNFEKNLVTVVIESRLAMPIYRPTAFVFGDFASAIANYSA
jgi:HK97 family phage major capsid protein